MSVIHTNTIFAWILIQVVGAWLKKKKNFTHAWQWQLYHKNANQGTTVYYLESNTFSILKGREIRPELPTYYILNYCRFFRKNDRYSLRH
jgi:hypothetical protein